MVFFLMCLTHVTLYISLDQSYYAFALIRCGDQVRDTPLYEITSADTDMYFNLTIVL